MTCLSFGLVVFAEKNFLSIHYKYNFFKKLYRLGDLSFSIYLWHWPIYIFLILLTGKENLFISIFSLIITITISKFSYDFIENPIRKNKQLNKLSFKKLFWKTQILLIVTSLFIAFSARYLKGLFIKNNIILTSGYEGYISCSDNSIENIKPLCFKINKKVSNKNILLIGDSHALHFVHPIKEFFSEDNILIHTQSGKPFPGTLVSTSKNKPEKHDLSLFKNQLELKNYIKENIKKNDIIIISNFYQRYFGESNKSNKIINMYHYDEKLSIRINKNQAFNKWKKDLEEFIFLMREVGAKVIILKATPELNNTYTLPNHCLPNYFNKNGAEHPGCLIDIKEYKKSFLYVDIFYSLLEKKFPSSLRIIDPILYMCDRNNERCKVYNEEIQNSILYDADHLTKKGASLIKPALEDLKPFFKE